MPKEKIEVPREPTPEEMEEMFEEQQEAEEIDYDEEVEDNSILMHCKPVYNFQSIEFDLSVNVNDPEDLERMAGIYSAVLGKLQQIAPLQPNNNVPQEPLASEKQKQVMDRFGIKYTATTTAKQAQKLINDNMMKG